MYKFEKIVLLLLIIFGISIFILFINSNGSISDSIYPELIGFSFEGIFLVILFGSVQRYQNKKNILEQKTELKKALLAEIGIFLYWTDLMIDKKSKDEDMLSIFDNDKLKDLIKNIQNKDKTNDIEIELRFIKKFAKRQLPNLLALLPTSANINSLHLQHWSMIINNIHGIIEAETYEKSFEPLIEFLISIQKFDNTKI